MNIMQFLMSPLGFSISLVFFIFILLGIFSRFLRKASPGTALVKTGFGLPTPLISTSSSFVIPLLHNIEVIDLTVKTIKISRRSHDSLSCADGIRAEVEVDFYIQINAIKEDIQRVATTIGCDRASNILTIREIFEAKFSDALKTAGSKLSFDQLYQNRRLFRDEILKALGQEGEGEVVLNGYKLDDVAIQYLEQLPLSSHDENNVLDSKGIKEIALRTSLETEAANKRLRQKEVTIAEQNQDAETKQLAITQDLALKHAVQEREIAESRSVQKALAEKTAQQQQRVEQEAQIETERAIKIAEEKKFQEIEIAQKLKEQAILVAEEEKQKAIEITRIKRETAQAEQLKEKLKILEETAQQEALKIKAEQEVLTVKEVEIANRNKTIEVINASKEASVEAAKKNVDTDVRAYELTTIAQAKLKAAELDAIAAEMQAKAILQTGKAHADALFAKITAEASVTDKVIMNNAMNQIIPLLPEIVSLLMKPVEKIDSIKILQLHGWGGSENGSNTPSLMPNNPGSNLLNTIMGVGMAMPILKEITNTIRTDENYKEMYNSLRQIPGAEMLMNYIEKHGNPKKSED
jgi:uncharacterized membrane protein YqiK